MVVSSWSLAEDESAHVDRWPEESCWFSVWEEFLSSSEKERNSVPLLNEEVLLIGLHEGAPRRGSPLEAALVRGAWSRG